MPPRCRRTVNGGGGSGGVACLLLAAVLVRSAAGRRVGDGAESNLTEAQAAPPSELAATAWRTANQYVGHRYILAASDVWTTYNNLKKIREVSTLRVAAGFAVTGEYFTTLQALREVDQSFTRALGVLTAGSRAWSCDQYYPDEELPKLVFTKSAFFPSETFESMNDDDCLEKLRSQIGMVRWSICHTELQASSWAEEMSTEDLHGFFIDTAKGKRCEGRPLEAVHLEPAFRPEEGRECVSGHSRTECAEACFKVTECSAMAYRAKTRECCFLGGEVNITAGSRADECYEQIGPRELFLMLDPVGVAEWLASRGLAEYVEQVRGFGGFGLTGIVVAFMTEPMLMTWLDLPSAEEAAHLRCRIDAELDNEPDRICDSGRGARGLIEEAISRSPVSSKHLDQAFLWPKGANGKWRSIKWISDFLRRYSPTADAKAWSSMTYDLAAVWLNAVGFQKIISEGKAGLLSPFVLLKAVATSSGLLKFRAATAFSSCESAMRQLERVIEQLHAVPMRQLAKVEEMLLGGR